MTERDDQLRDADEIIRECLSLDNPTSFFLYAGAGSGKTHSLVEAVRDLKQRERERLTFEGRRIAIITYTNAACDEISRRLEFDPLVDVSTIHAFAWRMIQGFDADIREWLRAKIDQSIETLNSQIARSRGENKTTRGARAELASKTRRLERLDDIGQFTYSPTGENKGRDSLNHSEVIQMAAAFIQQPPLLDVMVDLYPVLLIDESQDTNRHLMDAFLAIQRQAPLRFCLGLLGDTMQRIYPDGKDDLQGAIPPEWAKPEKRINRRCPVRVIELINQIRMVADTHQQISRDNPENGTVRMFCTSAQSNPTFVLEDRAAERMAEITGDDTWRDSLTGRKSLILEHKMAGRRMGFEGVFSPLHAVEHLRTGLLEGDLPSLKFLLKGVMPILEAYHQDDYAFMDTVRMCSPLLDSLHMAQAQDQLALIEQVGGAAQSLVDLFTDADPLINDVVSNVIWSGLLDVPERMIIAHAEGITSDEPPDTDDRSLQEIHAYRVVLGRRFSELVSFAKYSSGLSPFDTHQGVKGLEFPRVMVILNDEEAGGFLFSYEKLLGAVEPSVTDLRNEKEGKDSSLSRTRRLLYVTCSRAEESLALVVYSSNPELTKKCVVDAGWLQKDEVEIL